MARTKTRRAPKGARSIPGYSRYMITRNGRVWNTTTNRFMAIQNSSKDHWSGRLNLVADNGNRAKCSIAQLLQSAFKVSRESTIRRMIGV